MANVIKAENLFHRSRERVRDLGEVFTPEAYVQEMLDLISKNNKSIWSDEDTTFFEPSCGHGNIVIPIYRKRIDAFYKKALSSSNKEAHFYAIANALNTLWAIDVDAKNINECRTRILMTTINFLKEKTKIESDLKVISKNKEFIAHVLCSIKWHIHENETLSALSRKENSKTNAQKTKSGNQFFSKNGHIEMDFSYTWIKYFEECDDANTSPIDFERARKFVDNILVGNQKGNEQFIFAKYLVEINVDKLNLRKKDLLLG